MVKEIFIILKRFPLVIRKTTPVATSKNPDSFVYGYQFTVKYPG